MKHAIGIMSNLSTLGFPSFQAPINAQMLAQRQREILNQHLRQRQMHQQQQVQQRTLMMRGQGLNMTPSMVAPSGIPATMSNPRIPQANAQQFPFPPNYGTELVLTTSPRSFLPRAPPVLGHSSSHSSQEDSWSLAEVPKSSTVPCNLFTLILPFLWVQVLI